MPIGPPVIVDIKSDTLSHKDQELKQSGRISPDGKTFILYENYGTCVDKFIITASTSNLYDPILPIIEHINTVPELENPPFPVSTEATEVSWRIKFSKPVKNVEISNFALITNGDLSDIEIISVVPSNPEINQEYYSDWTITSTTGSGSGLLRLDLTNIGDIEDDTMNPILLDDTNFYEGQSYFVRSSGPIASITLLDNNVSNLNYVRFLITLDQSIANLAVGNLQLLASETLLNTAIDNISGSGTSWEVSVYTGEGYGHLSLQLTSNTGISPGIVNLFTPSDSYTLRKPLIERLYQNPISEKILRWKITFYEEIEKVYKSNFKIISNDFELTKIKQLSKIDDFSWLIEVEILGDIDESNGGLDFYQPVLVGSIGLNLKDTIGIVSVTTNSSIAEHFIEGPVYDIKRANKPSTPAITNLTFAGAQFTPAIVNYTDMSVIGIYYMDNPCTVGDVVLTMSNPAMGVMFSFVTVGNVNEGLGSAKKQDDSLSTYLQTKPQPADQPVKRFHIAVGLSNNENEIIEAPQIETLDFIYKDIVDTSEHGSGSGYRILNAPAVVSAYFTGDDHRSMSVAATFDSNEEYCIRYYQSEFDCKKEEWSDPALVNMQCYELLGELPEPLDWYLISACVAERTLVCVKRFCGLVPNPSPPKFQPTACCDQCVWFFKKIFDCETEEWVCVEASVICSGGGGDGTWSINGCEATTSIKLEILCKSAGDCPVPDCTKAPPGPFTKPISECCPPDMGGGGGDETQCVPCVGNCKFLGCSVVGFNGSIGWNTQESTVNIDLVEVICDIDGTGAPPEVFTGANLIGYPVYFYCGGFFFGGLMQNWTYQQNSGGRTYNVKLVDPRQILEQCVLIIDTYAGPPVRTLNYFNVYGFYEEDVYKNKNCDLFGTSESTERGMPYNKIMYALKNMNPVICTPVGANLTIDWSTFNIPVPEYFKIAGPSITILQLIVDICDEAGYDFFVTLEPGDIVRIYPVSLKQYDPIEDNLLFGFTNVIDFTYGKELRIAKTRNLLFGEQQHYLDVVYYGIEEQTPEAEVQYVFNGVTGEKQYSLGQPGDNTDPFEFFFGEEVDPETGEATPIVPYKREFGQFWVNIDIRKLNVNLIIPFPVDRMNICEYDIRTAMSSFESFWSWTAHEETPSELGKAIQTNWPVTYSPKAVLTRLNQSSVTLPYALADAAGLPNSARGTFNLHSWPPILEDIKKVHEWIAELGRTYYGRQYLVRLNEKVCVKDHPENFGEKMYTDTPTNDGGWVEPGIPVMGLKDPDLGLFRTDDDRVGSFALFCNPENLNDILLTYSGSGGGEYEYTLGSGILDISEPPPSGSGV